MIKPQFPFHFPVILLHSETPFGFSDQITPGGGRVQTGNPKFDCGIRFFRPFNEQFLPFDMHGISLNQAVGKPDDQPGEMGTKRSFSFPLSR